MALEKTWLQQDYVYGTNDLSATPESEASATVDGGRLTVKGKFRGVVRFHSDPSESTGPNLKTPADLWKHQPFSKWISNLCRWVAFVQLDGYEPLFLAASSVLEGKALPLDHFGAARLRRLHYLTKKHAAKILSDDTSSQFPVAFYSDLAKDEDACGYFVRCYNNIAGRRNLFASYNGYIGSGPPDMQTDDRITLVAGVPVPLVLRSQGDGPATFTLIGPAYVHGMMRGELWKDGELHDITLV